MSPQPHGGDQVHPTLIKARSSGAPVIDARGQSATFVWEGDKPPALIGDFNHWDPKAAPAWEPAGPGAWTCRLSFPADAYIEYGYVERDDPDTRLPDPFNSRTTPDGIGHIHQFFYMPSASPTPLAQRKQGAPQGEVTRHVVEDRFLVVGGKRMVHLYRPPGAGPFPLLVVYDGADYLRRGRLAHIADNLIAQGRIRPIGMAMVEHGGQARTVEYSCSEAVIGFVAERVLPLAGRMMPLVDLGQSPGAYGVLGASMGGLMALFTGMVLPGIFGRVLSQSGAFGDDQYRSAIYDLVAHAPVRPLKVWMDVGRFEGLLASNRDMSALLRARGYEVMYHELNAGHNFPAWRDNVWRGLEWVYPKS